MRNDYSQRRFIIGGAAIFIVIVYSLRLLMLQVMSDKYRKAADTNAVLQQTEYPARGAIFDRNGKLLVYNKPSYDVMVVMDEAREHLDTLALCEALGITRQYFDKRMADIKDRNKNPGYSSFTMQVFMTQLDEQDFAVFREKIFRFPGFYTQKRTLRQYQYPYGAHVLGDVAEVSQGDIENDDYYVKGDYIGKLGVERSYEKVLRGEKGIQLLLRDAHGRVQGHLQNGKYDRRPVPGKNITLAIDVDLQALGERMMEGKIGAIVAIEPKTGEVLCMVSSPTYDPRILTGRKRGKNHLALQRNVWKPLLNRSIMGQYPPGSTFKTSQALTFLTEGIITPETSYPCAHGFSFKGLHVGCHGHAAPLSVVPALSTSCNGFFCWGLYYMIGNRKKYGKPLVAMKEVQIANLGATIANRGYWVTPHVVKSIQGGQIDTTYTKKHYTKASRAAYDVVVKGMRASATGGTCHALSRYPYVACGKTGTAQNRGRDHSVFMGFAPMDNPKIAIAVYVENGGFGADLGVPIGAVMMEQYLTGKLSAASQAWANALQSRHIAYGDADR